MGTLMLGFVMLVQMWMDFVMLGFLLQSLGADLELRMDFVMLVFQLQCLDAD